MLQKHHRSLTLEAKEMEVDKLTNLTKEQREFVARQHQAHQHENFTVNFQITPFGDTLEGFQIHKGVWDFTLASSVHHAGYIFYHTSHYLGKRVLEMGCGTGLHGIITRIQGAHHLTLTDISILAVQNARANVQAYGLTSVEIVHGDLFEKVSGRFDFIIWNQPFFPDTPPAGDTIAASMLAPPSLIERFLCEARCFLAPRGVIMMPHFSLAGDLSNPMVLAPSLGYRAETTFSTISKNGLQRGVITINEFRLD